MQRKKYLIETITNCPAVNCNNTRGLYLVTAKNSYEAVTKYIERAFSHNHICKALCKAENLIVDDLISLFNNSVHTKIVLVVEVGNIGIMYLSKDDTLTKITEDE